MGWALHAVHAALWLALPMGAIACLLELLLTGYAFEPRHVLVVLALTVLLVAGIATASILTFLLLHAFLRSTRLSPPIRSFLATAGVFALPALWLAFQVNRRYLPGKLELPSILGNLAMLSVLFLVVAVSAAGMAKWMDRVRSRGRAPLLRSMLLVGIAVILPMGATLVVHAAAGPDVIVVLIDALRMDHLGAYGYERPTSPRIDAFAQDGIVFEQAISPSGFTKTSIASLFTGLDPHAHGVFRGNRSDTPDQITSDFLSFEHTTLAEALTEQGLVSVGWVQNLHLADFMGFSQGFAVYRTGTWQTLDVQNGFWGWFNAIGRFVQFFAYLHIIDLHDPYNPPEHFDGRFGHHADPFSGVDFSEPGAWSRTLVQIRSGEREVSPQEVEQLKADYDEEILAVDESVGQFLDVLRAKGLYEESIIVITSDHGDGFMEHGFISHATTPYDELVRVPLIVKLPRSLHGGTRIHQQVRTVDIAPTLIELLGAPTIEGIDGESLVPLFEGEVRAEHSPHAFVEETGSTGVRTEEWKVLYFVSDGRWEIYDLRVDPDEQNDLSADPPPEVAPLQALILEAVEERSQRETGTVPLDERTIEWLRSLGYIR